MTAAKRPPAPPPSRIPLWPLAFELAQLGTPIGVLVLELREGEACVVVIDMQGQLWDLRRLPLRMATAWCLRRHLRVYRKLGQLVADMHEGHVLGWIPGHVEEARPSKYLSLIHI